MNIARRTRTFHLPNSDAVSQTKKRRLIVVALCLIALAVYSGTAVWGKNTHPTYWVIFDELADSFLHGHLYLANPPSTHDLTPYNGHWYAPFPPLGALLLLPWLALFGVSGTNGIFFSIICGAI